MRLRIVRTLAVPLAAAAALALTGATAAPGASDQGSRPAAAARLIIGYVANSGSGTVTPFDTSLNRPGRPIAVHGSPVGLLALPNGHYVWVASSTGVTAIGTHFNKAGPLIPIPGGAASMALGYYFWVTAGKPPANRTEVFRISDTAMKAGKPVTFSPGPGAGPAPLAYSTYTKNLYTASALGVVTEIHVHTSRVGRVIPFGFKDAHGTARLAISPDGKTLYAFGADPARTVTTVTPVSLVTGKAGPPVTVGQGPQAIVFSLDSRVAYVVSTGAGPKVSVAAKVTPISIVTGKTAPALNLGPTAASVWASVMPGGAKLYVSARWAGRHANSLFSVSTATNTIIRQVRPSFPGPIAFTPDGRTAFIIDGGAGLGQGAVVSVTTATDAYHPGFLVGKDPAAIAVTPRWEGQTG